RRLTSGKAPRHLEILSEACHHQGRTTSCGGRSVLMARFHPTGAISTVGEADFNATKRGVSRPVSVSSKRQSLAARRDFWRAAVLGLMMPLATALSIFFCARRYRSSVGSPASAAARTFFMAVFTSLRTDLLRRRRTSFWRFRLICDFMLAMESFDRSDLGPSRARATAQGSG